MQRRLSIIRGGVDVHPFVQQLLQSFPMQLRDGEVEGALPFRIFGVFCRCGILQQNPYDLGVAVKRAFV